jgi:hypothetical protein
MGSDTQGGGHQVVRPRESTRDYSDNRDRLMSSKFFAFILMTNEMIKYRTFKARHAQVECSTEESLL